MVGRKDSLARSLVGLQTRADKDAAAADGGGGGRAVGDGVKSLAGRTGSMKSRGRRKCQALSVVAAAAALAALAVRSIAAAAAAAAVAGLAARSTAAAEVRGRHPPPVGRGRRLVAALVGVV